MNQQPDKFFREKLEDYHRQAPVSAWDRIDAGLQKKETKGLYWKVAASLLVVAVATYTLWPSETPVVVATKSSKEITPSNVKDNKDNIATPVAKETIPVTPSPVAKVEIKSQPPKHRAADVVVTDTPQEEKNQEKIISEEITPIQEENKIALVEVESSPVVTTNASSNETPAQPQTVTLVVSAKEADEYLDKKGLAQATSKEKKSSTLKKLLKKADDLANDQDPFGELRQKKNEILALNFKSEKQRGQNK